MRKKKMPLSEVLPGQTARVAEIRAGCSIWV